MRRHLTYSNAIATIALFISLGAGAYAAGIGRDAVKSRNIDDGTIRSRDIGNEAIFGKKIKSETLTTKQIREDRLDGSQLVKMESSSGFCNPSSGQFVECASLTVQTESPSRFFLIATGEQISATESSGGHCVLVVNGVNVPGSFVLPGEVDPSGTLSNGFATTQITGQLPKANHSIALRCNETAGDTRIDAQLSVIAVDSS